MGLYIYNPFLFFFTACVQLRSHRKLNPSMLQFLLRNLVFDVPQLSENSKMPLKVYWENIKNKAFNQKIFKDKSGIHNFTYHCGHFLSQLLTNHYEQSRKYYCLNDGWGGFGSASEEELRLTRRLFWGIFSALAKKVRKDRKHSFIALSLYYKYAMNHVTIQFIAPK